MKVLIYSDETYDDAELLAAAIDKYNCENDFEPIECIIHNGIGVGPLIERWADEHGMPVMTIRAIPKFYGPLARKVQNNWLVTFGKPDAIIILSRISSRANNHLKELVAIHHIRLIHIEEGVLQ
jgi:hypothetical protein